MFQVTAPKFLKQTLAAAVSKSDNAVRKAAWRPVSDEDIQEHLLARRYHVAFDLLLRRYQRKVFGLAYSMLKNPELAEDVTQDVFVTAWKGLPDYRGQAALSTWLYAIARNACLNQLKRGALAETVAPVKPAAHIDTQYRQVEVNEMLEHLPARYAQVLRLFYLQDKSYEEVAVMLGIPMGTVKTYIHRAKKELARILAVQAVGGGTSHGLR